MTLRAAPFTRKPHEYEALGAATGRTRRELIAEYARGDGPHEVWLTWDGDRVAGVTQPWTRPDGERALRGLIRLYAGGLGARGAVFGYPATVFGFSPLIPAGSV